MSKKTKQAVVAALIDALNSPSNIDLDSADIGEAVWIAVRDWYSDDIEKLGHFVDEINEQLQALQQTDDTGEDASPSHDERDAKRVGRIPSRHGDRKRK